LIRPLDDRGYLPAGVHSATLDEVIARFGQGSEQREAIAQSLIWLLPLCRQAGIIRLLINGSFVTDRLEPNDGDCVLLQGSAYRSRSADATKLRAGLPFLEIKSATLDEYEFFRDVIFASDRAMIRKGVIEVVL
jgi:hypothetical protein